MQVGEAESNKISNMSFLCCLLVVFMHSGWNENGGNLAWLIWELIVNGLCKIAVPFFFVVSGYFLAKHFKECWWKGEILKRVFSLLIPFIIFESIAIVILSLVAVMADVLADRCIFQTIRNVLCDWTRVLGVRMDTGPLLGPLWYLRCLFIFVLFGRVFQVLVDRGGVFWLVVSFAGWTLLSIVSPEMQYGVIGFFWYGVSLSGILFFSMGIWLRKNRGIRISTLVLVLVASSGLFLQLIVDYFRVVAAKPFAVVYVPALLLLVWRTMPSKRWASVLVRNSFGLYLLHNLVQIVTGAVLRRVCVKGVGVGVMNFLLAVLLSLLICEILRKNSSLAKIVLGGR